jgi:RNA polymerase sigma-70 factor (ECF subfamily)
MTNAEQETLWVLRAQSGDREALNELLKAIQQPLYGYVFKMVGERALAEDVLQEVFIEVYRKLRWLEEPALLRPWVYRIASRKVFKRMKREQQWARQIRDEALLDAIPAMTPEPDAALELREDISHLLNRVSPASRAVIILHYFHDLALVEVAAVLGISIGTVKSRLAYGLSTLRRALKEQGDSEGGND